VHDFKLLKESKINIPKKAILIGDLGYQGIKKIHENSLIPHKKTKNNKLDQVKKLVNRIISSIRVKVEHIIENSIKVFKIFSTRFRNKKENVESFVKFIVSIYNLGLI